MKPEVLMWFEVENEGIRSHFRCFLLEHRMVLPKLIWNIHSVSLITSVYIPYQGSQMLLVQGSAHRLEHSHSYSLSMFHICICPTIAVVSGWDRRLLR